MSRWALALVEIDEIAAGFAAANEIEIDRLRAYALWAVAAAQARIGETDEARRTEARSGRTDPVGGDAKERGAVAHAGAGGGLSRSIRRRMSANRSRGMTTSAIWNVT